MRSAEAEGHAEALAVPDGEVGPHFARRLQQNAGKQVGTDANLSAGRVDAIDDVGEVPHTPIGRGVLEVRAEYGACVQRFNRRDDEFDPEAMRPGAEDGDHLRMRADVHEVAVRFTRHGPANDGHRLGGRGRFVEQRSVRHRQAGQVDADLLEVDERFEPTLRHLGLVRRIGGVPAGVLQHVPPDRLRHQRVRIACPDEAPPDVIPVRQRLQLGERSRFGRRRRQVQRLVRPDRGRHRLPDQLLARGDAERGEHGGFVRCRHAEVPGVEFVGGEEIVDRRGHGGGSGSMQNPGTKAGAEMREVVERYRRKIRLIQRMEFSHWWTITG